MRCGISCEIEPIMETVQIVLEKELLQAVDRAARRAKRNRSALVRDALRKHLRRLEMPNLEARDREGYSKQAAQLSESRLWEAVAGWPRESRRRAPRFSFRSA